MDGGRDGRIDLYVGGQLAAIAGGPMGPFRASIDNVIMRWSPS